MKKTLLLALGTLLALYGEAQQEKSGYRSSYTRSYSTDRQSGRYQYSTSYRQPRKYYTTSSYRRSERKTYTPPTYYNPRTDPRFNTTRTYPTYSSYRRRYHYPSYRISRYYSRYYSPRLAYPYSFGRYSSDAYGGYTPYLSYSSYSYPRYWSYISPYYFPYDYSTPRRTSDYSSYSRPLYLTKTGSKILVCFAPTVTDTTYHYTQGDSVRFNDPVVNNAEMVQEVTRLFSDNTVLRDQYERDRKNYQTRVILKYVRRYNKEQEKHRQE